MKLAVSFVIYIGAMIWCLASGHTMVIALFIGLGVFAICAMDKGFKMKQLFTMGKDAVKDAIVVIEVMFTIGFITAIWRSSGTIAFFVYYGMKLIKPELFLIITFLLSCLLSYALGTSFGVAGTVGVIFMALARSGAVNPYITAGVVMSGIYFGDRGSPVSSSAILVASITKTDLLDNVKNMMKTAAIPLALTVIIYGVLSFLNPIKEVDDTFSNLLEAEFNIKIWCIIPALCMLLLPLLKVSVLNSMFASIVSGILISCLVQDMNILELLKSMILGYKSLGNLGNIFNGGGLISMIEVVVIITMSSTYSGIFQGTKMLEPIQGKITSLIKGVGTFPAMVIVALLNICVFCNQTIASMMCNDLMGKPYIDLGKEKKELAMDLENSVILLSGIVPWAIACSVPLAFMGVGYTAMIYSCFLYLVPICYWIQKKLTSID